MSSYSEFKDAPDLVRKRAKVLIARNFFWALIFIVVGLSLALDTANNIVAYDSRATLLDCVEPTGECYRANRQREGERVTNIVVGTKQIIVETLACNNEFPSATPEALEACVDKRLKEKQNEQGNSR